MMSMYDAKTIASIYGVSERTARRYMLEMVHEEKPLRVSAKAFAEWRKNRTRKGKQIPVVNYEEALKENALKEAAIVRMRGRLRYENR